MGPTPSSPFSSLSSDDPPEEGLPAQGTGLSDPTCSNVVMRRKLLELVKSLGGSELGLPRILVVGSQSVGKSSLIENITGITVPRDSGTCTRCPIECYMHSSTSAWQATVSLRHIVDSDGTLLDRPTLEPFGDPIGDRAQVEMRIREAQNELLNPDPGSALRFTRNSIVLEIKGHDVDDLAFVDLPGVIASAGQDGRESDVAEVEDLVSDFIKDPHCLILLVISCETDPENQRGRHLVRQFDPSGERTIPVLTKPDRIGSGDEGKWLGMLRNRTEIFKHGWFCVKQPSTTDLQARITPKKARENERHFFTTTRPWSTSEPGLQARFGTKALAKALGQKLFEVIAKRLPDVQNELNRGLNDVDTALGALQYKVPEDPVTEIHDLISQFHIRIHDTVVKGTSSDPTRMIQTANEAYDQFVEDIGSMIPRFRPWPRSGSSTLDPFPEYPDRLRLREGADKLRSKIVYLDEISAQLAKGVTRELPSNYPYQVKVDMIRGYINEWWAPSKDIVYTMDSNLRFQLSTIVDDIFKNYTQGGLHALIGSTVDECLDKLKETCLDRIRQAFDREHSITRTHQVRQFEADKETYMEHYGTMYKQLLEPNDFPSMLDEWDDFVKKMNESDPGSVRNRPRGQDIIILTKHDPTEHRTKEVLTIMAEVRSYYDLARQRYTDNVPMILDQSLVLALVEALRRALNKNLPISGEHAKAKCEVLLQPSEEIVASLKELETRRAQLEKARRDLKSIWTISR